jgi:hypothetical protein
VSVLGALARRVQRRWGTVVVATLGAFVLYQALILGILIAGLGGAPNYVRVYPAWDNADRIVRHTPAVADIAMLIAREPLVEYGRRHPVYGAAVWSFELTWSSLLFFVTFSALVGIHVGIAGQSVRWSALGSVGGAGIVALLGAGVSSLAHCGLGSFGVLLAVAGISATTIRWFGYLEPVLIPAGYVLMALAILVRGRGLTPAEALT